MHQIRIIFSNSRFTYLFKKIFLSQYSIFVSLIIINLNFFLPDLDNVGVIKPGDKSQGNSGD